MGAIIGLLTARGLSEPLARAISYAALVLLLLGTFAGLFTAYNHHIIAVNNRKVEHRAAPATDKAATERATDTVAIQQHEQEMHREVASQPDQPIAPTSRVRGCDQLRRAGRNPPACRGLGSGSGAQASAR